MRIQCTHCCGMCQCLTKLANFPGGSIHDRQSMLARQESRVQCWRFEQPSHILKWLLQFVEFCWSERAPYCHRVFDQRSCKNTGPDQQSCHCLNAQCLTKLEIFPGGSPRTFWNHFHNLWNFADQKEHLLSSCLRPELFQKYQSRPAVTSLADGHLSVVVFQDCEECCEKGC